MTSNPLDYPLCFDKLRRLTHIYAWQLNIPKTVKLKKLD